MIHNTETVKEINEKINNSEKLKKSEKIYYRNMIGYRNSFIDFTMTFDEIMEYMKCQQSIVYFAEKYIKPKMNGVISDLNLRDYQKTIIQDFENNRFNILLISRQIGNSLVESILSLHDALFNINKKIEILNIENQSNYEKMNKIKELYLNLPFFLKQGILILNKNYILFDNGSSINSTVKSHIYLYPIKEPVFDIDLIPDTMFIGGMSFLENDKQENLISNLSKLLSKSNSKIFISSSPNGINTFYDLFINSERYPADPKKTLFKANRIYWWQVEGRDEKWKQEQIKQLGSEELFNQQYDLNFISYKKNNSNRLKI